MPMFTSSVAPSSDSSAARQRTSATPPPTNFAMPYWRQAPRQSSSGRPCTGANEGVLAAAT